VDACSAAKIICRDALGFTKSQHALHENAITGTSELGILVGIEGALLGLMTYLPEISLPSSGKRFIGINQVHTKSDTFSFISAAGHSCFYFLHAFFKQVQLSFVNNAIVFCCF
jgi:hypothetical protein